MSTEQKRNGYRIGVISDTHGLLRSGVTEAFQGVDLILHAGDIDQPRVLKALKEIAPVKAVCGNMDRGEWTAPLPVTDVVEIGDTTVYMIHNIHEMDLDPSSAGFQVVIFGHSHQPKIEKTKGVLFLNPGSAGPRRFNYPITAAVLEIGNSSLEEKVSPRIIEFPP
jgi:uncharacterized protein